MGFIKLVVFGFVGLTVVYWSVALFARSVTKERLENKFDAENPEGDRNTRDAYIADGLREYDTSIRGCVNTIHRSARSSSDWFISYRPS